MTTLDSIKYRLTDKMPLDKDTAQALKNALPKLSDTIDTYTDNGSIPKEYIEATIIPALTALDVTNRQALVDILNKNKSSLHGLANDVHTSIQKTQEALTFASRKGIAPQKLLNTLPGVVGPKLQEAGDFLTSVSGIQDAAEREKTLLFEVFNRAKKVQAKFDDYVYRGDGKQYGSGGSWTANKLSGDDIAEFHGAEGKIQAYSEVEDTDKDTIEDILKMLTDSAKDPKNVSVNFVPMGGKNVSLGSKLNQLAEMASYLDALERGIDDANQGWLSALTSLPAELGVWLTGSLMPSNLTNTATSVASIVFAIVAFRKGWITTAKLKSIFSKGRGSVTTPAGTPAEGGTTIPESTEKFVTVKGKEYYNPKSDSYKELETSVKDAIEKAKTAQPAVGTPGNPGYKPATVAISEKEANIRTAKAMRLLDDYKEKFANGKFIPSKGEFELKLSKVVEGKTIIVHPTNTGLKRVWPTVGTAVRHPIIATREATTLVKEGISGQGWSLNNRMASIRKAEDLTAGSKNEPFKIDGISEGYTFKGDHAKVSAEMKEIENLLKERAAVEKWLELEGKIAAQQKIIAEMTTRAKSLKDANSYFKTTSQATSQPTHSGIATQTNTNQDLTDTAKQVEEAITKATEEKARLEASAGSNAEYKRTFSKFNHYTVKNGQTLTEAGHEFTRLSGEITSKVNSSYNTANGVAAGNPNKFRENERGININKFLKILAESMKK